MKTQERENREPAGFGLSFYGSISVTVTPYIFKTATLSLLFWLSVERAGRVFAGGLCTLAKLYSSIMFFRARRGCLKRLSITPPSLAIAYTAPPPNFILCLNTSGNRELTTRRQTNRQPDYGFPRLSVPKSDFDLEGI